MFAAFALGAPVGSALYARYGFSAIARENDCTMAQLALAWLLAKAPHIIPIPGTTRLDHLAQNARAAEVRLLPDAMERMEALINPHTVSGPRYNAATLPETTREWTDDEWSSCAS